MTTFFRNRGHKSPAVLWNPTTDSPVYEFAAGLFSTDDPDLIQKMRSMGFVEEPIPVQTQVALEVAADLTKKQPPAPPDHRTVPAHEPIPAQKSIEGGSPEPKTVHHGPGRPVTHKPGEKK